MKVPVLAWRRAAVLFAAFVAWEVAIRMWRSGGSSFYWIVDACLVLAAVASAQLAFGQPKVPRLVWRIFGPLFSVFIAWTVAWSVGWLATRLAVRPLTVTEKLTTFAMLSMFVAYAFAVLIPLYELGEWRRVGAKRLPTD